MCVKDRHEIFGQIVGATVPGRPSMEYSELGKFIDETIMYYIKINTDVIFDRYVIMPNHIHMIIIIRSETGDRGRSPLQFIVRNLKSYVTKQAGFSLWQKSFHDHIIRNENEYNKIADYIDNNPMLWKDDCFYPK
jgi:REP element-mobilizing transposase RayT